MKKSKLIKQSKEGYGEFLAFQLKYFIFKNLKHCINYEKY